ncbi:MAG: non-ribosomal peptide synthetase [Candidatus Binatia bacterium]
MQKQFIPKRKDRQAAPLSFAQQRLWFLDQLEPNSPRYNVSRALRLRGELDLKVLQKAIDAIVSRHETLRSNFREVDGLPTLITRPSMKTPMTFVDLSDQPTDCRENTLIATLNELVLRPYNLSTDSMLRASLVRLTQHDHVLLLVLPHITSDGWSMVILCQELMAHYDSLLRGQPCPLPDLPIQYADYAFWQREWLQGEVLGRQLSYWSRTLAKVSDLNLPTDRSRPALPSCRNGAQSAKYPQKLSDQLNDLARTERATLFITLLAAFNALLYRYSGQNDIAIGCPIANRRYVELERLIGFFANTLVFRNSLSGDPTFRDLIARVREVALGAYEHQDVPFEKLVDELQPDRDLSRNPLFQVIFQLRNFPSQLVQPAHITVEPFELHSGIAKFDLSLAMTNEVDGLKAEFEYNPDLFESSTITRMLGHFQTLLAGIVANPDQAISELPLLSEAEKHQLLVEWNDTKTDYPEDRCIHQLFEAQVEKTPDAIAVVFQDQQLTYRELNRRANQLAHFLRKRGVGPETLVALCVERSLEMVVGLLAILKAGGAYVPMDPDYPCDRLDFMLRDTQAAVLLIQERLYRRLPVYPGQRVCFDQDRETVSRENGENLSQNICAQNLAYVIYTSGSTGKPKGVMIEHRSAVAFLRWAHDVFKDEDLAGVLASTSICFDLSVFELFAPLTSGGRIILVENALALGLLNLAVEPTLINTVPSVVAELLRLKKLPPTIRTVNLAGEPLKASLVEAIFQHTAALQVYDLYGPTETTTYSTYARRTVGGIQTIGRPITNTKIYILDSYLNAVPVGVPGELYIGGAGLARGYLNRPDLTAEKFVPHRFSNEAGARLYRTGDFARYLPDGSIEYLGRMDNQVKIRGHRIELGEIESVLGQHPSVRESVILAREDSPGDRRLVGYVVARPEASFDAAEVRKYLKQKLPEPMIPSALVLLDELPLTPNGKVDRRGLPAAGQNRAESDKTFTAPRTPVEEVLASDWSEVLKVDKVGTHDNFFDLGGNSLLAVQIVSRIRSAFSIEFPLRSLFEIPTIAEMAAMIEQNQGKRASDPELAQILREVEAMTEEEAQKIVAK